jgi:hypothetical protein
MNVDVVPNAKWLHHFSFNNLAKEIKISEKVKI